MHFNEMGSFSSKFTSGYFRNEVLLFRFGLGLMIRENQGIDVVLRISRGKEKQQRLISTAEAPIDIQQKELDPIGVREGEIGAHWAPGVARIKSCERPIIMTSTGSAGSLSSLAGVDVNGGQNPPLPPHSENVEEELHRIHLALEAVFSTSQQQLVAAATTVVGPTTARRSLPDFLPSDGCRVDGVRSPVAGSRR